MELVFTKENGRWVAEFEVTGDFNLHVEGVTDGNVAVYQRGASSGEYAFVRNAVAYPSYGKVYDYDFAALVYPKYIKIVSEVEPTMAIVTFAQ